MSRKIISLSQEQFTYETIVSTLKNKGVLNYMYFFSLLKSATSILGNKPFMQPTSLPS